MSVHVGSGDDGLPAWIWYPVGIVAVVLLGGLFVFFFVEFEDFDDEEEALDVTSEVEADPYAWAKQSQPQQQAAPVDPTPAPQPVASSQYPGWMWDAQTNQWVPDPNHPQQ